MVKVYVHSGGTRQSRPTGKEEMLLMKRIVVLLTVAAMLAVMLMVSAVPAAAQGYGSFGQEIALCGQTLPTENPGDPRPGCSGPKDFHPPFE